MTDIPGYEAFAKIETLDKGMSGDKKYRVETRSIESGGAGFTGTINTGLRLGVAHSGDGERLLLRVS
ncbi:MAG: hypothetical protein LBJ84_01460, partial [Oscillospiraceae bacterium]|nr:hypothetical protein [Oscillospiraceae bacterium]